jgi:uncharacterized membrane protein
MSLTHEERRQIYEEEKARLEAQQQPIRGQAEPKTSPFDKLNPNVAGLLCYVGGWISGIIFLVLEEKNRFVRFHAAQSIIVFGTLNLISMIFGWIPGTGGIISGLVGAFSLVFWVVLMVKAYQGELYKVPVVGDIAENWAWRNMPNTVEATPASFQTTSAAAAVQDIGKKTSRNLSPHSGRIGRIIASAFAIAFSMVALVVFNVFNQYIAFYNGETADGTTVWTSYPFFTHDVNLWLPILTLTLILTIIFHIVFIIFDNYIVRELGYVILDVFALATVLTLLTIFPFDFSQLPDALAADITHAAVTIALILVSFGIGIGILVRLIKLIVNMARGKANYRAS